MYLLYISLRFTQDTQDRMLIRQYPFALQKNFYPGHPLGKIFFYANAYKAFLLSWVESLYI